MSDRVPPMFEIIPRPWLWGWDVMRLRSWHPAEPGQVGSSGYEWAGSTLTKRGAQRLATRLGREATA